MNKILKEERKLIILIMIVYFIGVMVGTAHAISDKELAYEAFSEVGLTGYDIIKVEYEYFMSFEVTLYITAYHKSGKRMYFILKKQKSIFWEKHKWHIFSALEL